MSPNGYKSERFEVKPYNNSSLTLNKSQFNLKRCQNKLFSDKLLTCHWPKCHFQTKIRYSFERHEKLHKKDKKLICDRNECKRSFISIGELNSHIKRVHSHTSDQRLYVCDRMGCESSFKTEYV